MMFDSIRSGDSVTIVLAHGGQKTGRAVLYNRMHNSWTLNMGGKYGTTMIAIDDNVVGVRKAKNTNNGYAILNGRGV